jgi:hypothetical protein
MVVNGKKSREKVTCMRTEETRKETNLGFNDFTSVGVEKPCCDSVNSKSNRMMPYHAKRKHFLRVTRALHTRSLIAFSILKLGFSPPLLVSLFPMAIE